MNKFNSSSFEKIVLLITELTNAYFINVCFINVDFIATHKIRDKEIFFESVYFRKMSEIGIRNFTF